MEMNKVRQQYEQETDEEALVFSPSGMSPSNGYAVWLEEKVEEMSAKASAYDRLMSGGEKTPKEVANFLGMYIAKNLDGTWWGYDKKPIIPKTDNTIWANTYGGGFLKIPVIVKKTIVYNGKWQDSLAIPEKYLEELGVENGKN